jgi:predicted nucleic acid-binding Zn ribbon protein
MKAFFLTQGIETCYPGYSNYKKIRFDEDTTNTDFDKRVILRHDNYPYMDSLKFLEENQSFISNCDIQLKGSGYYILNDTSGQYEDVSSNTIECNHCGREVQEDDSVYVDNSNDENHNCSLCCDCGVYSDFHNTHITREYAVYVDSVDSWVIRDYAIQDYSGEYIVPRDAIVLVDGRYADHDDGNLDQYVTGEYFILNSSSYEYVEYNNQYYKVEDCEETKDGVLVPSQLTIEHEGEVWLKSDLDDHLNLNLI